MARTGRPKWIPPPPAQVEALAAQGLTEEQIADALGISQQTLILRKKEYSEFAEAIKKGKAKGIAAISNALFQKAKGGDTTAMIFYLKARAQWSDKPEESRDSIADKAKAIRSAMQAIEEMEG